MPGLIERCQQEKRNLLALYLQQSLLSQCVWLCLSKAKQSKLISFFADSLALHE